MSFGLHLARPMSKAPFRSIVSFCNRRRRVEVQVRVRGWSRSRRQRRRRGGGGGGKDPFGISDPAGMQTPTSPSGAESLTTECLSPPFLFPFICPLVALAPSLPLLGRDRTVFRKIPSRVNIAVKCMCMRNYAVINASGHRFSVWKRDARIFSVSSVAY